MIRLELLRTRVARRILLLFVLGALAPVVLLAGYSFWAVTRQLRDQSSARLQQLSKSAGMSIMERLRHAEADLALAAANRGQSVLDLSSRPTRSVEEVVFTAWGGRPDSVA